MSQADPKRTTRPRRALLRAKPAPTAKSAKIPEHSSILDLCRQIETAWRDHNKADNANVAASRDNTMAGRLRQLTSAARMAEMQTQLDRLGFELAALTPTTTEEAGAMLIAACGALPCPHSHHECEDDDNRAVKANMMVEAVIRGLAKIGGFNPADYGAEHYCRDVLKEASR
jgi:hypothetical protein